MASCNYDLTHEVTGLPVESKLHARLKELYPESIDSDGVSTLYKTLREDQAFLDWFGDWTDAEVYEELQAQAENTTVFNEQGEPNINEDRTANRYYILNSKGEKWYLKQSAKPLTSSEINQLVNTLTGDYLVMPGEARPGVNAYIRDKIAKRVEAIDKTLEEGGIDLRAKQKLKRAKRVLNEILNENVLMDTITARVEARIGAFNFKMKYNEDTDMKEEEPDTHDEILNFILDSNETSNRAIDDVEVLVYLSSIPKFTGPNTAQTNPYLLSNQYLSQAEVWDILESTLTDVTPEPNKPLFQTYIETLELEAELTGMAELKYIVNTLKSKDENFQIKFATAFYKAKQNYLITQVTSDQKGNLTIKVIDPAEVNSKPAKIAGEYVESITFNTAINPAHLAADANLKKRSIYLRKDVNEHINFLEALLKAYGLNTHPQTATYMVRKAYNKGGIAAVQSLIDSLIDKDTWFENTMYKSEAALLQEHARSKGSKASEIKKRLIRPGTFLREVAEAERIFKRDLAEATLLVGGSKRWQYSYMSALKQEIINIKNGDTGRLVDLAGSHDNALLLVNHLLENLDQLEKLEVYTNSEIKGERDPNGVAHKKITEIDLHLDILAKMFNSKDQFNASRVAISPELKKEIDLTNYITYNFGADKNSLYAITGLPILTTGKDRLWDLEADTLGEHFKEILDNYFIGEFNKAYEESLKIEEYLSMTDPVEKQKYLMQNLIPGYHYKTSKDLSDPNQQLTAADFKRGTYRRLGIFSPTVNEFLSDELNTIYMFRDADGIIFNKDFIVAKGNKFRDLMAAVYNDVEQAVKNNYEYLNNLIIQNKELEDGTYSTKRFTEVNTNINMGKDKLMTMYYIINSFINNYELSTVFNGHVAYYKQGSEGITYDDFLKRASVVASDGLYLYNRQNGESKEYYKYGEDTPTVIENGDDAIVIAIVNEIENDESKYASLINEGLERTGNNKLSYAHEVADAQGFVTPEHFKDLVTRIYGWSEHDEKMYSELQDDSTPVTDEHIRWIKNFSKAFTPLKPVYFGIDPENGMPVYLKYSVAALFDKLVAGTPVQKVLDQMRKQGVEQVIFKSGSKAANKTQTDLVDSDNNIKDDLEFNAFTIDSSKYKMQVQVPTKLDKQATVGNQAWKNVLVNMDLDDTGKHYTYRGTQYTAEEIYNMFNDTAVSILQSKLNRVLRQLGYDKEARELDITKLKQLLIKQLDAETEADLIRLLETDLPLETIPGFSSRAYPIIAALIRKEAGRIYTNGGSVVQVANIGFDRVSQEVADGVFFFDENNTELTPPVPNPDGSISKAKILLPFSSIFKKTGLSYNEFIEAYKAGKIDPRIFQNVVGYRIPNQSVSSNDSFEVVGILPPIAGDQAIVYHEITAKTGSDFDIDKMFLMMPNYRVKVSSDFKMANQYIADNKLTKEDFFDELEFVGYDRATLEEMEYNKLKKLFIEEVLVNGDDNIPYHKDFMAIRGKYKEFYGVEYIDDNTFQGQQNKLIELFGSILESPVTYDDLMSPLDDPNKTVKTQINQTRYDKAVAQGKWNPEDGGVAEYLESITPSPIEQLMPVAMVKARTDVLEAKRLISIMANNMTDLGESQKANLHLEYDLGFGSTSLSNVHQLGHEGDSNKKISKLVSYLMNAAVDAAKDSYIIDGNFTTYTANAAMLLVRMGVSLEDIFTILLNDEIVNFAKNKTNATAKTTDIVFELSPEKLDELAGKYLQALSQTPNKSVWEVIPKEAFLTNDPEYQELILGLWHLLMEAGKEMNDAVVMMKSDANAAGATIADYIAMNNRLEKVLEHSFINNSFNKWFDTSDTDNFQFNPNIEGAEGVKILGAMANNTLFLMREIANELFIETTDNVLEAIEAMNAAVDSPLNDNPQTIKELLNYLYPHLLQSTGHKIYDIDSDKREWLLARNGFAKEFVALKNSIDNLFLNELYFKDGLIQFPNYKNYTKEEKQYLKDAFTDLIQTHPEFVDKLVQYAFLTTGFKPTIYSFNEYIPSSYFIDSFHGKAVADTIAKLNDPANSIDIENLMTQMAINNPNNFRVVKRIPGKSNFDPKLVEDPKVLQKITMSNGKYYPFVRKGNTLYKLVSHEAPIYEKMGKSPYANLGHKVYVFETPEGDEVILYQTTYKSKVKELYDKYYSGETDADRIAKDISPEDPQC